VHDRLAEARALLDAIAARERADPEIDPSRTTRAWLHDDVAPAAVVLLHGLTNSPPQYDLLAPQLHQRGHAVIVPRMPYHGYRDRMTDAIERVRARHLQETALEAVVIAALCGARVVVLGISSGATLAGWLAARTYLDTAIAVAPFCGLRELRGAMNDALGALLRTAPNVFGWWDPRVREGQPPPHGYPRFATRALGAALLISTRIAGDPRTAGQHGRRAILVVNEHDPVVNNAHAARRFEALRGCGIALEQVVLPGLPHVHDIIEPAIPQARTDLVYPRLVELIES
jgi:alpha-beta hydrolase superfamily lysophospholipase